MYKNFFVVFLLMNFSFHCCGSAAAGSGPATGNASSDSKKADENNEESWELIALDNFPAEMIKDQDDLIVRVLAFKRTIDVHDEIIKSDKKETLVSILSLENVVDAAERVVDFYYQHGCGLIDLADHIDLTRFVGSRKSTMELIRLFWCATYYVDKKHQDITAFLETRFKKVQSQQSSAEQKKILPIIDLIRAEQLSKLLSILAQDPTINLRVANHFDMYPIAIAILHGSQKIIALLRLYKASLNSKMKNGFIPLLMARTPQMKQYLLKSGADVDFIDANGETPLITAVGKANSFIAQDLLNNGAQVDTKGLGGVTVLHLAFLYPPLMNFQQQGMVLMQESTLARHRIFEMLFQKKKVNICIPDDNGVTPFMNAIEKGHFNWVVFFLNNKYLSLEDLNRPDDRGRVPLSIAHEAVSYYCEHDTEKCAHHQMVDVLKASGAHANGLPKQKPPLMIAVEQGDEDAVDHLLKAGANYSAVYEGKRAEDIAQQKYSETGDAKRGLILQKLKTRAILNLQNQSKKLEQRKLEADQKKLGIVQDLLKAIEEEQQEAAEREEVNKKAALLKKQEQEKADKQKAKELKEKEEAELKKRREAEEAVKKEEAEKARVAKELAAQEKAKKEAAKKKRKKEGKAARRLEQAAEIQAIQAKALEREQQEQLKQQAAQTAEQLKIDKEIDQISKLIVNNAVQYALAYALEEELDRKVMQFKKEREKKNKQEAVQALKAVALRKKKNKDMKKKADQFRRVNVQIDVVYDLQEHAEKQKEKRAQKEKALALSSFNAQKRAIKTLKAANTQAMAVTASQFKRHHEGIQKPDHYTNPLTDMLDRDMGKRAWMESHLNMVISQFSYQFLFNKSSFRHSRIVPRIECQSCASYLDKEVMLRSLDGLHWSDVHKLPFVQHTMPLVRRALLPSIKKMLDDQKKKDLQIVKESKLSAKAAAFSLNRADHC